MCGRCGLRNFIRADGAVPPTYCNTCDALPEGVQGLNVQLHGLCLKAGEAPYAWRVRILDPAGETVFSTELADRESGRKLLARISNDLLGFVKSLGL